MSKKHKSDKKHESTIEGAKETIRKAAKKVAAVVKPTDEKPAKPKAEAKPVTVTKPLVKAAPTPTKAAPAPAPVPAKVAESPKAPAPKAPAAKAPAAKVPAAKAPAAKAKPSKAPTISNEDIGLRAYFIAEKRHKSGLPGDSASDWIEAERQLKAEAGKPKSAASAKKPTKKA